MREPDRVPPGLDEEPGRALVACPVCAAIAEIEWEAPVQSTSGPVVMVKLRCLNRHWFLMPAPGCLRER